MKTFTLIRQVAEHLHSDTHRAERIIGIVLQELRGRLSAADAANVARHLPAALRPLWMDNDDRHPDTVERSYKLEFLGNVMECGAFPNSAEAEHAVVAVFGVMQRRLDGASRNARAASEVFGRLPHDLAVLWRAAEACSADAPQRRNSRPMAARPRSGAASRSSAA